MEKSLGDKFKSIFTKKEKPKEHPVLQYFDPMENDEVGSYINPITGLKAIGG
jgi:hypothetical protein